MPARRRWTGDIRGSVWGTPTAPARPHVHPTGDANELLAIGRQLQDIASRHAIHNVFSDNGYQELVLLTLFGLKKLRREGNDAIDGDGREYELKTVSRVSSDGEEKQSLAVTTEHTLTQSNIARYRSAYLWIIGVFRQSMPEVVYEIMPAALEPYFTKWEERLAESDDRGHPVRDHINNPKIPMWFIVERGVRIWPDEVVNPTREPARLSWPSDRSGACPEHMAS